MITRLHQCLDHHLLPSKCKLDDYGLESNSDSDSSNAFHQLVSMLMPDPSSLLPALHLRCHLHYLTSSPAPPTPCANPSPTTILDISRILDSKRQRRLSDPRLSLLSSWPCSLSSSSPESRYGRPSCPDPHLRHWCPLSLPRRCHLPGLHCPLSRSRRLLPLLQCRLACLVGHEPDQYTLVFTNCLHSMRISMIVCSGHDVVSHHLTAAYHTTLFVAISATSSVAASLALALNPTSCPSNLPFLGPSSLTMALASSPPLHRPSFQ